MAEQAKPVETEQKPAGNMKGVRHGAVDAK